ncbi:MAG: OsmC family peroxiredoxin [Gammaproteobacteria bacterium]|nr:MAG: OsmC family peroxiredoxin [Gammaproteobacteria bacterium]
MQYISHVQWKRNETPFNVKSYDRTHLIRFNGGSSIQASSAPEFVGNASLPNPEELFTASIASCFMLTFLYWAAMKGMVVDEYSAEAVGTLAKNAEGKMAVTEVVLKPTVVFHDNKQPDASVLEGLFKKAHENCFISSSVKTKVTVQSG